MVKPEKLNLSYMLRIISGLEKIKTEHPAKIKTLKDEMELLKKELFGAEHTIPILRKWIDELHD